MHGENLKLHRTVSCTRQHRKSSPLGWGSSINSRRGDRT